MASEALGESSSPASSTTLQWVVAKFARATGLDSAFMGLLAAAHSTGLWRRLSRVFQFAHFAVFASTRSGALPVARPFKAGDRTHPEGTRRVATAASNAALCPLSSVLRPLSSV